MSRHVISKSIVNKSIRKHCLIWHPSLILKEYKKSSKDSIVRENLENISQTNYWAFIGRFPSSKMKLIDVFKRLAQNIWHENIRPSSNLKDMLKLKKGCKTNQPRI